MRENSVHLAKEVIVGMRLALRGPLAGLALVVGALTMIVSMSLIFVVSRLEAKAPVELFPHLVAQALAFGCGLPIAFAGGLEAFSRDRAEGFRHLLRESGYDVGDYFRARAMGLVGALFAVVGGGTAISGLVSLMFARRPAAVAYVFASTAGALFFAFSFSLLMAAVAMATLAPRGRRAGYIAFVATLIGLEVLGPWLTGWLPLDFVQVISLKLAFEKIRTSMLPEHDFSEGARAFLLVGLLSLAAFAVARVELGRVEQMRKP